MEFKRQHTFKVKSLLTQHLLTQGTLSQDIVAKSLKKELEYDLGLEVLYR